MAEGTVEVCNAMHRAMEYIVGMPNRGVTLKSNCTWDGSKNFKFKIIGRSDTDYMRDPNTRRSVRGVRTLINWSVTHWLSVTQNFVTLFVTESEQAGAVTCAQDMIFQKNVLESSGLQVELPMILECDNKGCVDLANNWTAGGRTRHVDVRQNWLRELKEEGILIVQWIPGSENDADMHTKNLGGPSFEKFCKVYYGNDEYMS